MGAVGLFPRDAKWPYHLMLRGEPHGVLAHQAVEAANKYEGRRGNPAAIAALQSVFRGLHAALSQDIGELSVEVLRTVFRAKTLEDDDPQVHFVVITFASARRNG